MKKISVIIISALLLLSCSTTKRVKQVQQQIETDPSRQLLEQVVAVQPAFQSMQSSKARFKIDYSQHSYAVSGAINLIADSAIVISLQPLLGIELYRMEILPGHLTLIDKMNRRYVRLTYQELSRHTGVSLAYNDIQSLFMNRVFMLENTQSEMLQKKIVTGSNTSEHQFSLSEGNLSYNFVADKQNLQQLQTAVAMPEKDAELTVDYEGHRLFGETLFPERMQLNISAGGLDATCQITFVQPVFNQKANVTPANLDKLTPTSLSAIIK